MPRADLHPTSIGACVEATAGSGTATTAVALPGPAMSEYTKERFVMVANTGSVQAWLKLGASSGPDASSTTIGGGRAWLPVGSIQLFRRRIADTHAYLYAASDTAISIVDSDGV